MRGNLSSNKKVSYYVDVVIEHFYIMIVGIKVSIWMRKNGPIVQFAFKKEFSNPFALLYILCMYNIHRFLLAIMWINLQISVYTYMFCFYYWIHCWSEMENFNLSLFQKVKIHEHDFKFTKLTSRVHLKSPIKTKASFTERLFSFTIYF